MLLVHFGLTNACVWSPGVDSPGDQQGQPTALSPQRLPGTGLCAGMFGPGLHHYQEQPGLSHFTVSSRNHGTYSDSSVQARTQGGGQPAGPSD